MANNKKLVNIRSFTLKADRLLRVLTTPVEISKAFDPVKKPQPPIILKSYTGIWDTGATGSVVTNKVVTECGLKPTGVKKVYGVHGEGKTNTYLVNVRLPNKVDFSYLEVTEGKLVGADVLIGMDIIASGDFAITGKDGKTTFSFAYPALSMIDFAEAKYEMPKKFGGKIGRNEPCPCGSGLKFKKCCGSN